MSANGAVTRVKRNAATMANTLDSTENMRHYDWCCGIHGAARFRKGIKRATSAARRRVDKVVIEHELEDDQ